MRQKRSKKSLSFWIPAANNKVDVIALKPKRAITTFQQVLRATIVIGQVASLLPVVGVFSDEANNVKFVKSSWKCLYSIISMIGQTFIIVMCLNKLAHSTVTLFEAAPAIFYITTCITMVIFFQAARRWPQLMQNIASFEEINPCFDNTLKRKCCITCAIILILGLLEHILSLFSAFTGSIECNIYGKSSYKGFIVYFYPWIFDRIPYTVLLGIIVQFLHMQATYIWNFSDIFVICISYYLTSILKQVNEKVQSAHGKYLPEIFWRTTREDYSRATQIVQKVDDVISGIIFISFANNLFFVCLQLFNIIKFGLKGNAKDCGGQESESALLGGYETSAYYLFSLIYLLLRSIAVSIIASEVNTAAMVPARVLYAVPSPVYCVEVQRFLDQVNGETVALSGLQFFFVTRGLLLTVAGTIITYELVLVQFEPSTLSNSTTPMLPVIMTMDANSSLLG